MAKALNLKEKLEKDLRSLLDKKQGYLKAGYPRFMRLFGRDSLIASWELLGIRPDICRSTLKILSGFQGKKFDDANEEEPGKILHETDLRRRHHPKHKEMPFPYYGSVDATPLFLIVFALYFEKTQDRDFLNAHLDNVTAAAEWLERKIQTDEWGFIRYQRKREQGQLFHQGWKDGFLDHLKIEPPVAMIEVQGYAYLALEKAGQLLNEKKYERLAEDLKKNFAEKFWMKEKNFFALAVNGRNKQRRAVASNPGHLLFTGILEKNQTDATVKMLFRPNLWTRYGVRTHSLNEPDFDAKSYHLGSVWPHDNWIIAQGLKKSGYDEEYQKIKEAILTAGDQFGCMPELYEVTVKGKLEEIPKAQKIQAWSAGAALNFLTADR